MKPKIKSGKRSANNDMNSVVPKKKQKAQHEDSAIASKIHPLASKVAAESTVGVAANNTEKNSTKTIASSSQETCYSGDESPGTPVRVGNGTNF
jgi:hypothetical protein